MTYEELVQYDEVMLLTNVGTRSGSLGFPRFGHK